MHTSVHKSSVPDSYMLLFIVKSYLNVSVLRYVGHCMHACSFLKTETNSSCVCAHLANTADSDSVVHQLQM